MGKGFVLRKLWIVVVAVCLSLVTMGTAFASDVAEPVIAAESAIVVEASTGRVVYEKNADMQSSPASMTKMMTCLLALDELGRHQDVMISKNAARRRTCRSALRRGMFFRLTSSCAA